MKKLILTLILLFTFSAIVSAQTKPTQLQLAQAEINKLNILLEGKFEEVRNLIIQNEEMAVYIKSQSKGIVEATNILQIGVDSNDGKVDFEALVKLGFKLNLPDSTDKGKKPDNKPSK